MNVTDYDWNTHPDISARVRRQIIVPAPTIEMFAALEDSETIEDRVATGNYLNKLLHVYRDESGAVITEEVDDDGI